MPVSFNAKLDKRFQKEAQGRIERFSFEVGVLEDKPHKLPLTAQQARKRGFKKQKNATPSVAKAIGGLKSFAGGPARKIGTKNSGLSIAEVSEELRKNTRINFYTKPWKSTKNADIVRFIASFFKLITGGGKLKEKKRLENLLQAVVRNPILRGDYGRNKKATERSKGFNRFMIDTAQLFRGITAKVRIKNV